MAVAYALSLLFALVYGRAAARYHHAEQVLMPLLDVLQRVPVLSFLPVVLLSFRAILSQQAAAELASIVLIFTSQVWHLVFAWHQSLKTIRNELREAAAMFGFTARLRWRVVLLDGSGDFDGGAARFALGGVGGVSARGG
jgi:NitT/TauT family transport system permease protein